MHRPNRIGAYPVVDLGNPTQFLSSLTLVGAPAPGAFTLYTGELAVHSERTSRTFAGSDVTFNGARHYILSVPVLGGQSLPHVASVAGDIQISSSTDLFTRSFRTLSFGLAPGQAPLSDSFSSGAGFVRSPYMLPAQSAAFSGRMVHISCQTSVVVQPHLEPVLYFGLFLEPSVDLEVHFYLSLYIWLYKFDLSVHEPTA